MQSRWNETDANAFARSYELTELGLRVYSSRLLGQERTLVLHGGGNTSVKTRITNIFGEHEDVMFVKGSGSDLAEVRGQDFAGIRYHEARRLVELDTLDSDAMAAALIGMTTRPGPKASIETILHAILPWPYVEHTHADAILALTNTASGARIIGEVFGECAPLVPFRSSGFELAKACDAAYRTKATQRTIGLILDHHGAIAFGNSARESYENMLRLVTMAEDYLKARHAWQMPRDNAPFAFDRLRAAQLRARLCRTAGFPLLLSRQDDPTLAAFARRNDLAAITQEGPATPQHAVFIKREPLVGLDVETYAARYARQVERVFPGRTLEELGLDPAPRVVIDPDLGVWVAAVNAHYLRFTSEILRQDIEIKTRANGHDRYAGLPVADLLHAEIHYGGFERALRASGRPLLGECAAILTSAEEPQLAQALSAAGAAVRQFDRKRDVAMQLDEVVQQLGGVDVLIVEAGLLSACDVIAPLLQLSMRGGRLVLLGGSDPALAASRASGIAVARIEGAAPPLDGAQARLAVQTCDPPVTVQAPHVVLTKTAL
ncbi:MAG TPA: class II aldolase/adducin family protein [Burkholderiales bacterium]|nr:class II aldolase/adducin family protein [Burkholderiales bacterium]